MSTFATILLIWLPPTIILILTNTALFKIFKPCMLDWTPSDQKFWSESIADYLEQLPTYILKDVVEKASYVHMADHSFRYWTIHPLLTSQARSSQGFTLLASFLHYPGSPHVWSFLSTIHLTGDFWDNHNPLGSMSLYKAFFLHWMVEWKYWKKVSVGSNQETLWRPADIEKGPSAMVIEPNSIKDAQKNTLKEDKLEKEKQK